MQPLRILQVFATLDRGGAESRVMDLYAALDRDRVQFDFLVMAEGRHSFDDEVEKLGGRKFVIRHPREEGFRAHVLDLVRLLRSQGPFHAVHAHTSYHSGLILAVCWALGIKRRVAHARTTGFNRLSGSNRLLLRLGRALINRFATARLAISKDAALFLFGPEALNDTNVKVVPNAIPLDRFATVPAAAVSVLKESLGLLESPSLVLGHVGRFSRVKNHEFLLRVLEQLRARGREVTLLCVGGGELQPAIQKQASKLGLDKVVHFLGVREDVHTVLSAVDVFAMPSLYEGLGGAAIEAQAAGLPCFLSDQCPASVDLGLGLVHFLPINDPSVWATALETSECKRIPFAEVETAFMNRGFTIQRALECFADAYGIALRDFVRK